MLIRSLVSSNGLTTASPMVAYDVPGPILLRGSWLVFRMDMLVGTRL